MNSGDNEKHDEMKERETHVAVLRPGNRTESAVAGSASNTESADFASSPSISSPQMPAGKEGNAKYSDGRPSNLTADSTEPSVKSQLATEREMRVFRPTDVAFDPRRLELPEDFYAPTLSDVQVSLASLSGTARAMDDAPLLTKKLRDIERAKKMSRYQKVLIRVKLPDRTALQGTFAPSSTIRDIIKFVNDGLRDPPAVKYHLFVVPPKTILKNLDSTLWSQGFVPAALVYLGLESGPDDSSQLLSDATLAMLEDIPPPGVALRSLTAPPVAAESAGPAVGRQDAAKGGTGKTAAKLSRGIPTFPKWFKK